MIDRLILGLGLGSTGQQISPGGPAGPARPARPGAPGSVPVGLPGPIGDPGIIGAPVIIGVPGLPGTVGATCSGPEQVCQHVTTPHGEFSTHLMRSLCDKQIDSKGLRPYIAD